MRKIWRIVLVALVMAVGTVAVPTVAAAETYEEIISDPALTPEHSVVIRFYRAVLGRQPDVGGLRFWLDSYDSGEWPTRRIAGFFATSDEFVDTYGETDNAAFTTAIYRNVLGRSPDASGFAYWKGALDRGMERSEMILLISNAPEFIENNPLPSDDSYAPVINLSGSGDSVVAFSIPGDSFQVLELTHRGDRNFIVWAYGADSERIELLANHIGDYSGAVAVNGGTVVTHRYRTPTDPVRELEIQADGDWTISVRPKREYPTVATSGPTTGSTDEVLILPSSVTTLTGSYNGRSNFIVWGLDRHGDTEDLVFNEIGNYTGTAKVDEAAEYLSVQADGAWTLCVSAC